MITKNYIKMCKKTKEIQKLKPTGIWHTYSIPHDDGLDDKDYLYVSFYYLPNVLEERNIQLLKWDNDEGHPIIGSYSDNIEGAIWLPTQEQLQEMIKKNWVCEADMVFAFKSWIEEAMVKYELSIAKYTTTELWLAFVMKERWNKKWAKKGWTNI